MTRYVLRRLVQAVPTLFGLSVLVFLLMNWVPGNPVEMMFDRRLDPEAVERISRELGLYDPLPVQYGRFLWRALHGDLGRSLRTHQDVTQTILQRFPATVRLAVSAMLVGVTLGLAVGLIAAVFQNRPADRGAMLFVLLGISMPVFWVAMVLQLYFGYRWRLLPISGYSSVPHMVLPAIALGTRYAASIARMTRSSMLEVLRQDYVRTARAKGASERLVLLRHAFKNALVPIVTLIGLEAGGLLTGAVLTESVFGIPGLGRLAYEAILYRDYLLIQGVVLFTAAVYILANLAVDVAYAALNPRIRYD
ncbi:MAG: ABC transporter permease [Bacillota bacterium]